MADRYFLTGSDLAASAFAFSASNCSIRSLEFFVLDRQLVVLILGIFEFTSFQLDFSLIIFEMISIDLPK